MDLQIERVFQVMEVSIVLGLQPDYFLQGWFCHCATATPL